ncbi:MAG TPA: hypothetical protein VK654_07500 [Nitrospirota bacterium]|nr:hypothetical protein [Nitrospirota bacterium]
MAEMPAGPVLTALELRVHSFSSLKAVAGVEIRKSGRPRSFDTVGIVVDGQRRFRMEAFGPLGQSLAAVVWDGREVSLRLPDQEHVARRSPDALAQILGEGVDPAEFCAVLAGSFPAAALTAHSRLLCAGNGDCVLVLDEGKTMRKIRLYSPLTPKSDGPRIRSYELIRSGETAFLARFEDMAEISHYPIPLQIIIENTKKNIRISIRYSDVDMNVPVHDDAFSLPDEEAPSKGQ